MVAQLSLFGPALAPGLYAVHTPYRNEMGHAFKVGERVQILDQPAPEYVVAHWPDEPTGQRFHLNAHVIANHWRPVLSATRL